MTVEVGVARETAPGERRVALTPETCKKLVKAGAAVRIERGAGASAGFTDADYTEAGARVVDDGHLALGGADVVLCVQSPDAVRLSQLKQGAVLVGVLQPQADAARGAEIPRAQLLAFPLERLPRTTRAQAMDVLSSQAGMAGYKAVLIAAQLAPRFFPMLTTAAGTIRPSRVLIVGAGVAGLQAVATAKRLGRAGRRLRRAAGNARTDRIARRGSEPRRQADVLRGRRMHRVQRHRLQGTHGDLRAARPVRRDP